jgi:hypothetical protein
MYRLLIACFLLLWEFCPAVAQEREWNVDATQDDAYLIFGTPGTDDVGTSFLCKVGQRRVTLFVADALPSRFAFNPSMPMVLSANEEDISLRARLSKDAVNGRISAEADMVLDGRTLSELSKADHFSVSIRGHRTSFPFDPEKVAEFRKACVG